MSMFQGGHATGLRDVWNNNLSTSLRRKHELWVVDKIVCCNASASRSPLPLSFDGCLLQGGRFLWAEHTHTHIHTYIHTHIHTYTGAHEENQSIYISINQSINRATKQPSNHKSSNRKNIDHTVRTRVMRHFGKVNQAMSIFENVETINEGGGAHTEGSSMASP